ncbi:hypothetical protein [Lentimicrobium sp. S6]|uniref:hypothetical protein n=1 Tax=Lentimicrobium sp. S6 TaxID=2735872 RepID=UPI0015565C58|nr:hypothetical protein [Lentimicrobium sp. S6]NPD47906.1 hypothetical protein [Lentimicrobium sp. S6]
MTKPILLSKSNPSNTIQVGDEPFLLIEYIDVKTKFNRSDFYEKVNDLTVEIIFYKFNQEKPQSPLMLRTLVSHNPSSNRISLSQRYNLGKDDIQQVEFRYKNTGNQNIGLEIGYLKINKIEMHEPIQVFNGFLRKMYNSKILFSAPFGHGKTTFLQEFGYTGVIVPVIPTLLCQCEQL